VLDLEIALARLLESLPPQNAERVALMESAGRFLAERISSPLDLPAFDNSAMDGYAVRASDVRGARADSPITLKLAAKISAGELFAGELLTGECARIFTGAPLPRGADAVVMQEDAQASGAIISILDEAAFGENVRKRGEDVNQGEVLADAGEEMSPGTIALLAATGFSTVTVGRRPNVALIATGSELREPGDPLLAGQIYESNRAMLSPLIERCGGLPTVFQLVPDTLDATRSALRTAFSTSDIVVTSGGVSVGELDFVKSAFESLGGELQFWKVAMRPGKPFVLGRLGEKFLFGLPGNPVSAFVTFLLLVRPAILRWQGAKTVSLPTHTAVLGESISNSGDRRHFVRVRTGADGKIFSAGKQASHALSSLAAADGLLDVPPRTTFTDGSRVDVLRCV
jgi:molybdopterin molybdotransferase